MSPPKLQSLLADQIQNFIDLRRLSGTDYHSQAQLLGYFDRFLVEGQMVEPRITRMLVECYLESLSHLAPRTRFNRFSVVKQLCQYLARDDPLGYVPDPLRSIPSRGAHQPYIYSNSEVHTLMMAAFRLPPENSLRPYTYRTLLGLLYSTGIRIGEASALNLEHFYNEEQLLYIAEGKFRKARWVALSDSTCQALQQYKHKRLQMLPRSPDSPFFINQRSCRLHHCAVNQAFRQLLRQCHIHHNKNGPRLHDISYPNLNKIQTFS